MYFMKFQVQENITGLPINMEFVTTLARFINKDVGIFVDGSQWPDDFVYIDYCYKLGAFNLFYHNHN